MQTEFKLNPNGGGGGRGRARNKAATYNVILKRVRLTVVAEEKQ